MTDEEKVEDAPSASAELRRDEKASETTPASARGELRRGELESDVEGLTEETLIAEAGEAGVVEEAGEPSVTPEMPADEELEKLPGMEIRITDIKPGMTIRIHERIKDLNAKGEERERIQVFQGMVIGIRGAGDSKTMTLRRQHKGYGTEKIYPLKSPVISKVELVKTAKVRRAKLAYLQNLRNRFKRKLKEVWAETK